ncbi:terpenoid synthase [Pluteus cervinus]|uniref:Terpenoid synthase n=1 Tax=Pluteus cervinus TaxID=181527 RepID=A0ACD3AKZ5_9AGAR|nr:terpenoid synthase [Pluteus cervinus]
MLSLIAQAISSAMNLSQGKSTVQPQDKTKAEIRHIIEKFLSDCHLDFAIVPFEKEFYQECCDEVLRRGYSMGTEEHSLRRCLHVGVGITTTAYAHLPRRDTQMFIAIYTGLLVYVDDACQRDVNLVKQFNRRFITGQPQADPILDSLAKHLHEFPDHYDPFVADLMLTSTLNFITAQVLEWELKSMRVPNDANKFLSFTRILSGASEPFALFVFPADIPFQSHIHSLPEVMVYSTEANDVFSYYKEVVAGETANYVSTVANCRQVSKIEALRILADDIAAASNLAVKMLKNCPEAHEAYLKFAQGYADFHFSSPRYKLEDLFRD